MTAAAEIQSPPQTRHLTRNDFVIALIFAGMAALVAFDAWKNIFMLAWWAEELSYVLLAPIVIFWIASAMQPRWGKCEARSGWPGLLVLVGGFALFGYGYLADPVLWRAGAVFMTVGAFLAAVGTDVLKKFLPVFGACLFLIPVHPNSRYHLAQPLEVTTAEATQSACDILGISVDRSGNLLSINGVEVTVAEACNGMRMVITLFLVCYLVAFTEKLKPGVRILLLVASPLVAVIANVARLVPTVWLFGHISREAAENFHTAAGWGMIVVAFLALMGLSRLIQRLLTMDSKPKEEPHA